jgi:hypothetical protein
LLSTTKFRGRSSDERGQVLALFGGALIVLFIIAALAFDVGLVLVERRDEQNAADAAALAGARYVLADENAARDAATRMALLNGYDGADANENVLIHIPPMHGRYAGFPGFIEVQIESTRPSIFAGIIGKYVWPVGAFAVATPSQDLNFPFSMLALNPTACKAIQVSGSGEVNAVGTVQSNSDGSGCAGDPISFSRTGGSTINVGDDVYCRAFGEIQDQGSGSMDCTIDPNKFALPDPLKDLPEPSKPALAPAMGFVGPGTEPADQPRWCPGRDDGFAPVATDANTCVLGSPSSTYSGLAWILYPGLYPGGLDIAADTTAYLMPGIYWIGGDGIEVSNGGSIISIDTEADAVADPTTLVWEPTRGSMDPPNGLGGVLIYNSDDPAPGGPITQNGSSAIVKLMPIQDSTSPYFNIVIFQDRTLSVPGDDVTLNGSDSETVVAGLIYLPVGDIKLNGNGGTLTLGQVIASTYQINGDGFFYITEDDLFESTLVAAGLVD